MLGVLLGRTELQLQFASGTVTVAVAATVAATANVTVTATVMSKVRVCGVHHKKLMPNQYDTCKHFFVMSRLAGAPPLAPPVPLTCC